MLVDKDTLESILLLLFHFQPIIIITLVLLMSLRKYNLKDLLIGNNLMHTITYLHDVIYCLSESITNNAFSYLSFISFHVILVCFPSVAN